MLCDKCGRAKWDGNKHRCPKQITTAEVHKHVLKILKAQKESEKTAIKSKVKFVSQK